MIKFPNFFDLCKNYDSHPSFNSFNFPVNLSDENIQKFDNVYLQIFDIDKTTKKSKIKRIKTQLFFALSEIFCEIANGSDGDIQFKYFLIELESNCKRLLSDVIYYLSLRSFEALSNRSIFASQKYFFGRLSKDALEEIHQISNLKISEFHKKIEQGFLTREDLSVNSGQEMRKIHEILEYEFKANGVMELLKEYMGGDIAVLGVALELSTAKARWWQDGLNDRQDHPKTLYAHIDEFIGYPKAIVYLNDVDESGGPTSFYSNAYESLGIPALADLIGRVIGVVGSNPNSKLYSVYRRQYHQAMSSSLFREHFMKLPRLLRFNSHLGWDILPDSELEAWLVARENKFLGKSGDYVVFDGAKILHRGGMLQHGERLALQVVFRVCEPPKKLVQRVLGRLAKGLYIKNA